MNVVKSTAKTKDEALNLVLAKLNVKESEIIYNFREIKGGIFKGSSFECSGFLKIEVLATAEAFLKNIISNMGLEASIETQTKNDITTFKIYSSNNPILIGKNGQNLDALTTLVRQYIRNITVNAPKIILDVEDYKEKQIKRIERLAKKMARDVLQTKIDIEMDNMNSYERRIVHNILTDLKGIKTESVGEEPNRRVVIKYIK